MIEIKNVCTFALLFVSLFSLPTIAKNWQPIAEKEATIEIDNARFTVLTDQLIRLEYSPKKSFRDQASLVVVNRNLTVPEFSHNITEKLITITTQKLTLTYLLNSGTFNKDNLSITFNVAGKETTWQPGLKNTENLGGTARTLDGMNGGLDWNQKPVDLGEGVISRAGWKLLDDSNSHSFATPEVGNKNDWRWVEENTAKNQQDWYFFAHGHGYKQALKDYISIAGNIPIPPKYAFGYWWSRYWAYSDNELRELMTQMRDYDIPIDVLVIDMDWHLTHGGLKDIKNPKLDPFGEMVGWTGYTWNNALFPEPEKFLDWTKGFNLKTALNLHPASGIPPMESQYQAFAKDYEFEGEINDYIPYRLAEKKWAQSYVDTILHPLEEQGVDFWWLDWQQFPESKLVDGLSNTWWLNHVFFTDMERQNKRPLLFHRWGGMGNHRYQIGFSGDDKISWQSLQYQSYFTATAANVGYGYWSHDIGGHGSGELDKDGQLYLRWLQFGVLSPIFRTHSAKISTIERRFWQYPERFEAMRELVKFRYALTPYIYNAARQAYDTGVSIVRPMYYDHADQEQAYQYKYQYMFGDDLLVAPIDSPVNKDSLLATKDIWLPEGQWYEWFTGNMLTGDKVVSRAYAETEIPLFAKAGAIIPMYPDVKHLQQQISNWVLTIIPGEQGEVSIYEDNGDNLGYQAQQFATTKLNHQQTSPTQRMITIEAREGQFEGAAQVRQMTLVLPATFPVASVKVNNTALSASSWTYDAKQLANIISLPESSVTTALKIEVETDAKFIKHQALLFGKISQFNRLTKTVKDLKVEVARENWWATLPNIVFGTEQVPAKINYHPDNIVPLLMEFEQNYPKLPKPIVEHKDARADVAKRYVNFLTK